MGGRGPFPSYHPPVIPTPLGASPPPIKKIEYTLHVYIRLSYITRVIQLRLSEMLEKRGRDALLAVLINTPGISNLPPMLSRPATPL